MNNSQSYFNTTNQDSAYVVERKQKNKSQEEIIFEFFQIHKKLTASEVLDMFPRNVPLTSIRRAISNLQYDNKVQKTIQTKIGLYNKPECYYIISSFEDRQLNLF